MEKLRIVIGGFIGLYATGGVTWDYIQYPLGLRMLGHDVYYIEDTMQYSKCQSQGRSWNDSFDSIKYLKDIMECFGLKDRWAYRDVASGNCYGLRIEKVLEICSTADIFLNVSSANHILKQEYLQIPKRVIIDSDPMFTQVQYWDDDDPYNAYLKIRKLYNLYNYRFCFGENIGKPGCRIPLFDLTWLPTRQPICLNYWKLSRIPPSAPFTTVMNWCTRKEMTYQHEQWGQKDVEFKKILNLPELYKQVGFKLAVGCSADTNQVYSKQRLEEKGWQIIDPHTEVKNIRDYQNFIQNSLGEFSVAKETYVKSNSGWFSCRSACYLAAGRPVITQETQWSDYIPAGLGAFAFTDTESAIRAIDEVRSNLKKHSYSARELAKEYFDSTKVLQQLLENLN